MSRLTEERLKNIRAVFGTTGPTAELLDEVEALRAGLDDARVRIDALRAERDAAVNAAQGIAAKLIPELDEAERRGIEAGLLAAKKAARSHCGDLCGHERCEGHRRAQVAIQELAGTARTQGSGTAVTVREQKGKR